MVGIEQVVGVVAQVLRVLDLGGYRRISERGEDGGGMPI